MISLDPNSPLPAHNPYFWNGALSNQPIWATLSTSARDISTAASDQQSEDLDKRLLTTPMKRIFPLDGVNRLCNTEFVLRPDSIVDIFVHTIERGVSPTQCETRQMHVTLKEMPSLWSALVDLESTQLPAAINDAQSQSPFLYKHKLELPYTDMQLEVYISQGLQGQERLTRIVHMQKNGALLHGIAFPWIHTSLFNAKLRQLAYEEKQAAQVVSAQTQLKKLCSSVLGLKNKQ